MPEEMHDRLRQLRLLKGYETAADAARAFGWNLSTYKSHENGIRAISKKAALRYAAAFRVPVGWLLFGEGDNSHKNVTSMVNALALREVPRLSWAIVDAMTNIQQEISDAKDFYLTSPTHYFGPLSFVLTLEDDSMTSLDARIQESFREGDEIIVDPEQQPRPGDFVVARIDASGKSVFRQYRESGTDAQGRKIITLFPLNPNWAPHQIVEGETGAVIARLVRHTRNY